MALGDGAADQLGEDVVLAVEVEVKGAPGNFGRGEDVGDREVAEAVIGEQAGRGGQDGLAQVAGRGGAAGMLPSALLPAARLPPAGLPSAGLRLAGLRLAGRAGT